MVSSSLPYLTVPMSEVSPASRSTKPCVEDPYRDLLPECLKDVKYDLASILQDPNTEEHPPDHLKERQDTLDKTLEYLKRQQSHFMGFQGNQNMDYGNEVAGFLDLHTNNIGDPFVEGTCTTNTKFMERAVLDYYASLWNAKWPHMTDPYHDRHGDSYWGFLLTMGSTEGNMYSLWNARDYLSGKILLIEEHTNDSNAGSRLPRMVYRQAEVHGETLPTEQVVLAPGEGDDHTDHPTLPPPVLKCFCENFYSPVAFYSEDTHYSFTKATRLIGLPTFGTVGAEKYPGQCPLDKEGNWLDEVPSLCGDEGPGSIDIEKLAKLVTFFVRRGHPVFISLNYGSTFKGAYDDVRKVVMRLKPIFEKYGHHKRKIHLGHGMFSERTGYWIHVDGALGAAYMPYLKMASERGYRFNDGSPVPAYPDFDFSLGIHSISMSGHKWMGSPVPCGIFMSKRKYQISPPSNPVYIGTPDTTFAGSRSGFSAVLFWTHLSKRTLHEQIKKAMDCEEMAKYIEVSMKQLEDDLNMEQKPRNKLNLWVARTPLALTVRFKQLNKKLVNKYSLSNETLTVNGELRHYSHVFAMEHVTKELVDALVQEVRSQGLAAFAKEETEHHKRAALFHPAPFHSASLVSAVPFHGRGYSGN